jgi:hypothetical protein
MRPGAPSRPRRQPRHHPIDAAHGDGVLPMIATVRMQATAARGRDDDHAPADNDP